MQDKYLEYQHCIDACLRTASLATKCAISCTQDPNMSSLGKCIQLCIESAATCNCVAQLMTTRDKKLNSLLMDCAELCEKLATECSNIKNTYCQECAVQCRLCAKECRSLLAEPAMA